MNRSIYQLSASCLIACTAITLSACGGGSDGTLVPDTDTIFTITSGSGPCFFNSTPDSMATLSAGWTWLDGTNPTGDVMADYNIQDNSTGCGGTGGTPKPAPIATYSLTWRLPVNGGFMADLSITVSNETGLPSVVQGYTDTVVSISTSDTELGGGGEWVASGCPLDVSSVIAAPTDDRIIVSGTLRCNSLTDPSQVLTRPVPIANTPESSVEFFKPVTFTTVITLQR